MSTQGNWLGRWAGKWFGAAKDVVTEVVTGGGGGLLGKTRRKAIKGFDALADFLQKQRSEELSAQRKREADDVARALERAKRNQIDYAPSDETLKALSKTKAEIQPLKNVLSPSPQKIDDDMNLRLLLLLAT